MNEVEDAIGVTRSGPEADRLGVSERAVVAQPRRVPVTPGVGVGPAQEVLPATPSVLTNAFAPRRRAGRRVELLVRCAAASRIGGEARVEAHLVTTAPERARSSTSTQGCSNRCGVPSRGRRDGGEEVERAAQAVALADVHQEVEGVVRIEPPIAEQRSRPLACQPGIPPPDEIGPGPGDVRIALAG